MSRALRAIWSMLDPRAYLHLFRLVHFWNYAHVKPRRAVTFGPAVVLSPTVSFRNAEGIEIGARAHIGEYSSLWAGNNGGRIVIGPDALLGPRVYITASNYDYAAGAPVMVQPRIDRDVTIGADVWLGAGVIVLPGVTIGDGSVVAAGAIVTKDLPPGSIAAGSPARVIKRRTIRAS